MTICLASEMIGKYGSATIGLCWSCSALGRGSRSPLSFTSATHRKPSTWRFRGRAGSCASISESDAVWLGPGSSRFPSFPSSEIARSQLRFSRGPSWYSNAARGANRATRPHDSLASTPVSRGKAASPQGTTASQGRRRCGSAVADPFGDVSLAVQPKLSLQRRHPHSRLPARSGNYTRLRIPHPGQPPRGLNTRITMPRDPTRIDPDLGSEKKISTQHCRTRCASAEWESCSISFPISHGCEQRKSLVDGRARKRSLARLSPRFSILIGSAGPRSLERKKFCFPCWASRLAKCSNPASSA